MAAWSAIHLGSAHPEWLEPSLGLQTNVLVECISSAPGQDGKIELLLSGSSPSNSLGQGLDLLNGPCEKLVQLFASLGLFVADVQV